MKDLRGSKRPESHGLLGGCHTKCTMSLGECKAARVQPSKSTLQSGLASLWPGGLAVQDVHA